MAVCKFCSAPLNGVRVFNASIIIIYLKLFYPQYSLYVDECIEEHMIYEYRWAFLVSVCIFYNEIKAYYYYTPRRNAEEYTAFNLHFSKAVNIACGQNIFIPLYL